MRLLLGMHYNSPSTLSMIQFSISLAALYLRGAPRSIEARRNSWLDVLRSLRRAGCEPEDATEALRQAGHWAEALVLESPGLLNWARDRVEEGQVLSTVDGDYPCRWLRVMGSSAPPVLWKAGHVSTRPSISIVGSRVIPASVGQFCFRSAREAIRLGFAVVSGRAEGCDR